eukprot:scaffold1019_cov146-Skeletonema_menzelii.AAC.4
MCSTADRWRCFSRVNKPNLDFTDPNLCLSKGWSIERVRRSTTNSVTNGFCNSVDRPTIG